MKPSPVSYLSAEQYWALPLSERAILLAAERVGVRESGGANRGPWVERFLRSVGLGGGYSWCAAFAHWCLKEAGATRLPRGAAAVRNWAADAKRTGYLIDEPKRGCLFYWLDKNQLGHIGFVIDVEGSRFRTIEGNTNEVGSREGDGVYRKRRLVQDLDNRYDSGFIDVRGYSK